LIDSSGHKRPPKVALLWQLALSRAIGIGMNRPSLAGRAILVVEDEALIALDITQAFEAAGAAVTTTNTLRHALILVEHDGLCGAILDHALADGDSSLLCSRLTERGIPFMIYSGHATVGGACKDALHISKPAAQGALVAAMEGLIRGNKPSSWAATFKETEAEAGQRQAQKPDKVDKPIDRAVGDAVSDLDGK
jgi:DNA-binding response OmpR family regulator